ncbi:uncharacterized protein LOC118827646 [Colossoma macropomum]|uniref:uncharacterized protein LOC118827646 n=1 Tax=Colossoma macropomum TaxID=42526 RepID=UPI00186567C6|nr:uncharacterized protein LOC118827646 [Colossoma macropomum]
MSTTVAALLLFSAVFWGKTEAFSDDAMDCCLSTSGQLVPRHIAVSYIVQGPDTGCSLSATVFITRKGKRLCSPLADDKAYPWVAKLMAHLEKLQEKKHPQQQTTPLNCAEIRNILFHCLSAMSSTGVSSLCVALWLTGLLSSNWTVSFGDQAVDCCLSVRDLSIPHQVLVGYHKQLKENGCSIDAILFQTKKNKVLCAPPDAPWVKERMNWLDKELKKCQKNGFKGKRCQAMKPTSA